MKLTTIESGFVNMREMMLSPQYIEARRRVFRQLVEALIYESMVQLTTRKVEGGWEYFVISGQDDQRNEVRYLCEGKRKLGFGRVRLSTKPIRRVQGDMEQEADDLAIFLYEVTPYMVEKANHLSAFVNEIEQTLLKEASARYGRHVHNRIGKRSYDDLEGDVMGGHPYHPCFKSRIGFDLDDNEAYGPDFNPRIKLLWIAVEKKYMVVASAQTISYHAFIKAEIGEEMCEQFAEMLHQRGVKEADYVYVPVHPWQWREQAAGVFFRYVADGRMIVLGEGDDEYTPQQSIRTLSNRSNLLKWNVKVPIGIMNTSAVRILGTHHVTNAPILSDWLDSIVERDPYLREKLRLVIMKESMGISFRYELLPEPVRQKAYGTLGAIWRESIHSYLAEGEEAIPYTALCHVSENGHPFIEHWVKSQGLEQWLEQLLEVSILPLIHLLFAHGVAMESHGQNMVLIHKKGIPIRIALRDLPGGIRFHKRDIGDEIRPKHLRDSDDIHPNNYSTSPMETDNVSKIRNFLMDSFFQINLAEISMMLEQHYGYEEMSFWSLTAEKIQEYQREFQQYKESFVKYDLFVQSIDVGQLTRRRLFGEHVIRNHEVNNPLYKLQEE